MRLHDHVWKASLVPFQASLALSIGVSNSCSCIIDHVGGNVRTVELLEYKETLRCIRAQLSDVPPEAFREDTYDLD